MNAWTALLAGLFGLLIGSFTNVVVWRVPRGESVVRPPSACPSCGHSIRPRDNVPVLSWLLLRGRCRDCGAPISVRYPLVETGTAVLFAAVGGWLGPVWLLPAVLYLAAITVPLTLIDIEHRRLPNVIVLPAYPVAAALLALAAWNPGGSPHWSQLLRAGVGGLLLLAFFVVTALLSLLLTRGRQLGIGLGDLKLAGVLGMYLGWFGLGAVVVGAFAGFLLGTVYGVGLMVARRAGRRSTIPYGPFLLAGAWIGMVVGETLFDAYWSGVVG